MGKYNKIIITGCQSEQGTVAKLLHLCIFALFPVFSGVTGVVVVKWRVMDLVDSKNIQV